MDNPRRISIHVDEELYYRLQRCFEWGERNRVLTRLLNWLCEKIEKHGQKALMVLLREEDLNTLIKMGEKLEDKKDGNHN